MGFEEKFAETQAKMTEWKNKITEAMDARKRLQNGRFGKQLIFADCIIMLCHCVSPGCLKSGRAPVRFYNYRSVLGLTLPHTCASGRSFSSFPRQRASPSY